MLRKATTMNVTHILMLSLSSGDSSMLEQIKRYNEIVQITRKDNKNLAVLEVRSSPATLIMFYLPIVPSK